VIAAGGDPRKTIFSGVGKTTQEIGFALAQGIRCFNVESASELEHIDNAARQAGKVAPISLRVNPDVDARTHPYISTGLKENKFGVDFDAALDLYRRATKLGGVRVAGIDCHIGSQLSDPAPLYEALDRMLSLVDALAAEGIVIEHLDLGGGLGVRYRDENVPDPADYMREVLRRVGTRKLQLMFEPGRNLVANAGLLLTRVVTLKPAARNFAVVDAAMNDFLRPSLYSAWHSILQVGPRAAPVASWDIVGPVCESADFLGKERQLALAEGDLLAVMSAGAYGMVMASNYNSRPRAAEVMVSGRGMDVVRERESFESLYALERIPD
jgi:diaminopimelate decarboxylase